MSAPDPPTRARGSDSTATAEGDPGSSTGVRPAVGGAGRTQFAAEELAIVLSHYDTGVIEAIQPFPRGSRKAPKLVIRSDQGVYLLKRRAANRDDPYKVAFAHQLQQFLADRQFPLPHLFGTRRDSNTMLKWQGAIYELFEYIKGGGYDNSVDSTADAGRVLAIFHKLLREFESDYEPAAGSYHAGRSVGVSFEKMPVMLQKSVEGQSARRERVPELVDFLRASYEQAASAVEELGLAEWPVQIVHCDWHPGNMLFRGHRVVAVIDYDSARIQQRVLDVANGVLQFSILGGGDDTRQWPDQVDFDRFRRFLTAYESVPDCLLARAEVQAVPSLMVEALIAEAVIPIAQTGSFARLNGFDFLAMVERKVRWIQSHASQLTASLDG